MGELLRRFGMAVLRDNRLVCDDRAARALVDNLARRAGIAARNGEGASHADARVRLFSLFIRFYRRHVRLAVAEETASDVVSPLRASAADARDGVSIKQAVRSLPLELRESLMLVVLERFSHIEAAQALDISLAALVDRLARARAALAIAMARQPVAAAEQTRARPVRRSAPHLRLVK
jgi:DNA-directed RNA polymerase specialized sigma24 family protein